MLEGSVGDLLGAAHQRDLLGILDAAQLADVAVHARQHGRDRALGKPDLQRVVEREVTAVLDGDDARAGLGHAVGGPGLGVDDVLVDLPGRVGTHAREEGVVVARVGVQPQPVRGDKGGVRDLVVKGALGAGEPTQVGVVPQDRGIVAPLGHERAQALHTLDAGGVISHESSPFGVTRGSRKRSHALLDR